MSKLTVYTREPDPEAYPFGLSSAVHFSVEIEGKTIALNNDYGILFARGEISDKNTIIPLGIEGPVIFSDEDGSIVVAGKRIHEPEKPYAADKGRMWAWKTRDLAHFETLGVVGSDWIEGHNPGSIIEINEELAQNAVNFWNPPVITDDPTVTKYRFPLAKGYGDPVIFHWKGKWYFISTSDNTHDVGIYVREADSVPELFVPGVTEHLILPYDEERALIQTFWAPEFHVIGGELYILFAVSGKQWGPQCHLMKLKENGTITDPESWENPVRVLRKDGSSLAGEAITLDMTYFKAGRGSYVAWSYREHIGRPEDTGSMIYIASIDENEPWKLTSDPVLLSRPLFGWENLEGTINNEAPYTFIRNGKVYLTYSGGSANSYTYAVGLFTADQDADLLDINSWTKSISPILTFYSVEEYGPGHNSFFRDENDNLMIAYHGEMDIHEHLRCDMIRSVRFKDDGTPYFV